MQALFGTSRFGRPYTKATNYKQDDSDSDNDQQESRSNANKSKSKSRSTTPLILTFDEEIHNTLGDAFNAGLNQLDMGTNAKVLISISKISKNDETLRLRASIST